MKKRRIIAWILLVCTVLCLSFSACSSDEETTVTTITTDPAVIKDRNSVDFIKSLSTEQLGLEGTWDDYNFVAHNNSGIRVEDGVHDGYYVEVIVGTKTENADGTVSIDEAGVYLISYDGHTVLSHDRETDTYTELDVDTSSAVEQAASSGSSEAQSTLPAN